MELDYGEPTSAFGQVDMELNPRLAPGEIFDVPMDADDETELKPAERAQARRESEALRRGAKFYKLPQDDMEKGEAGREEDVEEFEEAATPPEVPVAIGGGLDVRLVALNLTGEPIKQLSTSRLFAYVTHCGAAALGLEWINDSSCNVVFADSESTLAGLACIARSTGHNAELLALPEAHDLEAAAYVQLSHERGEPTDEPIPEILTAQLLQPRRARAVPLKLYTTVEKEALASAKHAPAAVAAVPDDAPAIYAEMAAEEAAAAAEEPGVVALRQLQSALWVRFALESADNKKARASGASQWYAAHGSEAGREVVSKLLDVQPKQSRGRGNEGQSMLDALDAELDELRQQGEDDEEQEAKPYDSRPQTRADGVERWAHDQFEDPNPALHSRLQSQRREREPRRGAGAGGAGAFNGRYRERAALDALDEELESHASARKRDRSSSPARRAGGGSGHSTPNSNVRIRGRGAMRAPSAASRGWEDVDDAVYGAAPFEARAGKGAGMVADAEERKMQSQRRRGGRGQGGQPEEQRWQRNGEAPQQQQAAQHNGAKHKLADRFGGGSLLDRMG